MAIKEIKLIQNPYICGYEGAFCREVSEDGKDLATGVWNNWYEATAEDEAGNQYQVYWKINDDFDVHDGYSPESDACDWENPWMVLEIGTGNDKNVVSQVKIKF